MVYSTRKHEGADPRLRIVIPTDRIMSAEEYEPIARKVASLIGMGIFDPTRFMYWSSKCANSEWVFVYEDESFLKADGILPMYQDWRNAAEWPEVPGAQKWIQQGIKKLGVPGEKPVGVGVIGAFCRVYDIPAAINQFLPDVWIAGTEGTHIGPVQRLQVPCSMMKDNIFTAIMGRIRPGGEAAIRLIWYAYISLAIWTRKQPGTHL